MNRFVDWLLDLLCRRSLLESWLRMAGVLLIVSVILQLGSWLLLKAAQ